MYMEIFWKCKYKYCTFHSKSRLNMIKHENACSYNPKNLLCPTCKYRNTFEDGYVDIEGGVCPDYHDFICPKAKFERYIVMDEKTPCKFWVASNLKENRKGKLKEIFD